MSLEERGLRMALWPAANEAIATARMVWDLEAGIETLPFNRDLPAIRFIAVFLPEMTGD